MWLRYSVIVVHVARTLLLVLMVAQAAFLLAITLSHVGFTPFPLLDRGVDVGTGYKVYRGNPYYIIPLSVAMVLPVSYFVERVENCT